MAGSLCARVRTGLYDASCLQACGAVPAAWLPSPLLLVSAHLECYGCADLRRAAAQGGAEVQLLLPQPGPRCCIVLGCGLSDQLLQGLQLLVLQLAPLLRRQRRIKHLPADDNQLPAVCSRAMRGRQAGRQTHSWPGRGAKICVCQQGHILQEGKQLAASTCDASAFAAPAATQHHKRNLFACAAVRFQAAGVACSSRRSLLT